MAAVKDSLTGVVNILVLFCTIVLTNELLAVAALRIYAYYIVIISLNLTGVLFSFSSTSVINRALQFVLLLLNAVVLLWEYYDSTRYTYNNYITQVIVTAALLIFLVAPINIHT